MQKADSPRVSWRNVVFALTALLVAAADQLTKILWIRSYPEGQPIFEAGFFRIIRTQNTGAAFGLFQDQSFVLTIIALIGIVAILFYTFYIYRRFPYLESWLSRIALGLILGGTVGNLIDRLRLGRVTDFIDIGIWPAFNIADPALTVGTIILAYSLLSLPRAKSADSSE